jgi:two-component system heavy metal sensor histidine kinase CusS
VDADLLAGERKMKFALQGEVPEDWRLDARLIRQVLLNLLSNALAVGGSGAEVQLSVSVERKQLFLRMMDDGPGLNESEIERMFNRFERLGASGESKGNGLGLAICRSIVERHGGHIRAYNREPGQGLVVEIQLPEHSSQK